MSKVERSTRDNEQWVKENQDQQIAKLHPHCMLKLRRRALHCLISISYCAGHADGIPTVLKLKRMKGPDGLGVIETIAAGDYQTFGMVLLNDENGQRIDLITKDLSDIKATETIIKQWLTGTISDTNPYTRTYRHLVVCLKEAGMGALGDYLIQI